MVHPLAGRRLTSPAVIGRGLRAGARLVSVLLVLCGLAGAAVHVHHGLGSETCVVCVHARTPAVTSTAEALLVSLQPTHEVRWSASVVFAPTPCTATADSRAPPGMAPAA
jgi:hypothetical protein